LSYNESSEKKLFNKEKIDEMRADRLLSLLLLLQIHRRMTVRELAKRLEVSVRTVYRDMEALNTAGIPITAKRGADGGWFLLDGYRTNLTGLNESEVQALFVPGPSPLLDDLGLRKAAEGALLKVLAALPVLFRRHAEEMRQRIHIDAAGWDRLDEHAPWFSLLQEAVWQERKLFLRYRRRDESVADYLVDPLGLVAKANIWYLVGMVEQGYRVFRVSRIQSGKIADLPCIRPASFDLAVFWQQWSEHWRKQASPGLRRYPVLVRVAPSLVPHLALRYGEEIEEQVEQAAPPDLAGWIRLTFTFETEEVAWSHILSFGSLIEVLEPQDLRKKIAQIAATLLTFYQQEHPE
jgi:predicted DNA-binding transcriptional regulator YafY